MVLQGAQRLPVGERGWQPDVVLLSQIAMFPNNASSRSITNSSSSSRSGTTRTFLGQRSAFTALPQVGSTGIVDTGPAAAGALQRMRRCLVASSESW
jgi:hypothetical protein